MKDIIGKYATKTNLIALGITLLSILLVNLLAYAFIKSESAIYYWDISAYWKNAIDILEIFQSSFSGGVTAVIQSTATDYNYLPITPLLPLLSIFGTGRTVFILTIINMYIVPFAVIVAYACTKIFNIKNLNKKNLFYSSTLFVTLFFPPVLAPALEGRVDAISLVSLALILLLYAVTGFKKYRHYIILGLLICSVFVFRRYFSYWALGFFLAYALFSLFNAWLQSNKKFNKQFWSNIKRPLIGSVISGFTILAVMLVGFRDVFMRYITENYSDMYSAYYFGDAWSQVNYLIQFFGIIFIIVTSLSIYLALTKYRKEPSSTILLFILVQTIIIFIAFTRTQTFGLHHYYMIAPLFLWALYIVLKFTTDRTTRNYIYTLPVLMLVAVFSLISFTGAKTNPSEVSKLLFGATKELAPIIRGDIEEINNMANYLESTVLAGEYVYVLSSSHTFNDDILRNIRLPNSLPVNISGSAHVDKRDGFPNYFFDAQYVIVASPIQTHLEEGSQDVVEYPARLILNGDAKNLQKMQSFSLDKNVVATVYKKTYSYKLAFIDKIHSHFKQKYPQYSILNNIRSLEDEQ